MRFSDHSHCGILRRDEREFEQRCPRHNVKALNNQYSVPASPPVIGDCQNDVRMVPERLQDGPDEQFFIDAEKFSAPAPVFGMASTSSEAA
tara:strand:+ start:661 stop:933 length:273 start_codon:yes stop_codon:yes gene_type:complete